MRFKNILLFAITTLLATTSAMPYAYSASIPNELGAPKAGGLPREHSDAYEILYGSVRVAGELQRVIVTKPPGAGPKPALLFIGGMGCYSLDFSGTGPKADAYERIIDFITRLGFVTMRVEKTGMGDSQGTACENQDFHREVAGNLAGLRALAAYPFVKADEVYLFGHSIGGVIAPFLAAKVPVKGIAVFGSLAETWYDYELANIRRQSLLSGMSPQAVEAAMIPQQRAREEFYILKKTPAQLAQEHPELVNEIYFPVHWTYMQQLSEVNPAVDWNRSSSEVLILSGDSDFIGSQAADLSTMIAQANKTRARAIRMVQIPYIDHFFRMAFSQPESIRNANNNGMPLLFQPSIFPILQKDFLGR